MTEETQPVPDGPFRVDVKVYGETTWATNALRFATESDAKVYAEDLSGRWMLVERFRVVPSDTPDREPVTS